MSEIIFLLAVALIVFGPKKMPEIAREIGRFVAEFKRASNEFTSQIQQEINKASVDLPNQQQTGSFTQTFLPAAVTSAISEIDSAKDHLLRTARMAFDAQHSTVPTTVVALDTLELPAADLGPATPAPIDMTKIADPYDPANVIEAAPVVELPPLAPQSTAAPESAPVYTPLDSAEPAGEAVAPSTHESIASEKSSAAQSS